MIYRLQKLSKRNKDFIHT
jgi:hypothetical protein